MARSTPADTLRRLAAARSALAEALEPAVGRLERTFKVHVMFIVDGDKVEWISLSTDDASAKSKANLKRAIEAVRREVASVGARVTNVEAPYLNVDDMDEWDYWEVNLGVDDAL